MGVLEPDKFLNELHKMYERNKGTGSVWITMKRSAMQRRPSSRIRPRQDSAALLAAHEEGRVRKYAKLRKDGSARTRPPTPPPPPPPAPLTEASYSCLIRANDGKKHISTSVGATQHGKFQQSVTVIMKAHMDALKKREKIKPVRDGSASASGKDDSKK